ncbi:NAC transcription factor 29-like isoform X1 [Olea europaea subsp. europaea]|uniref:NAC transcription factor 29-like isoform X1 n=1 Tax=Olea europaea subsp. europaea TaxID=158383 RepID=A0A8S0R499_OLEEU|nr:NAC transcription factor 29-like isoform X1 [Olea europaea subsp. europaea]
MCPPIPSSLSEMGSNDEQIILSLDKYIRGSPLPNNVIADLDLYQYNPSNLPDGIWYFIHSNDRKETAFGFWKTKGETNEIYLNSELSGWRTTLEFFEGEAPNGRRTGWLMQEYSITQKGLCHKTEPKDSKSICRIFLSSAHSPKNQIQPNYNKTDFSAKCNSSVASVNPSNNNTSAQDSLSKSEVGLLCILVFVVCIIFSHAFASLIFLSLLYIIPLWLFSSSYCFLDGTLYAVLCSYFSECDSVV